AYFNGFSFSICRTWDSYLTNSDIELHLGNPISAHSGRGIHQTYYKDNITAKNITNNTDTNKIINSSRDLISGNPNPEQDVNNSTNTQNQLDISSPQSRLTTLSNSAAASTNL